MKPAPFEYYRPESLVETFDLLDRYGDDGRLLAGGQSLVPALNLRLAAPRAVIDINRIPDLDAIRVTSEGLVIGEAYLDGRWLKLDATIDADTAAAKGRPYQRQFDGEHDIPTMEGPILKDLESHADYPADVADWYETMAREVMRALAQADAHQRVASDDALWSGPPPAAGGP